MCEDTCRLTGEHQSRPQVNRHVAPSSVTPEIVPVCVWGVGGGGECVNCPQSAAGTEHESFYALVRMRKRGIR